jgi:superfamily II DNA/RNA helicase
MPLFDDFFLQPATRGAGISSMDITEPTPIQAEPIPALIAGKDFVGQDARAKFPQQSGQGRFDTNSRDVKQH